MKQLYSNAVGLIAVFLAACQLPVVKPPAPPAFPDDWGSVSKDYWPGTQCPRVDGVYMIAPEIYEVVDNQERLYEGDYIGFYSAVALYVAQDTEVEEVRAEDLSQYIRLTQDQPERFRIELYAPEVSKTFIYEFHQAEEDYACQDGFIVFPHIGHYGLIDGNGLNVQMLRKIGILEIGDLMAIRTQGLYRSIRSADHIDFTHELYRFRRVSPDLFSVPDQ